MEEEEFNDEAGEEVVSEDMDYTKLKIFSHKFIIHNLQNLQ
jgi:hypothetical protein